MTRWNITFDDILPVGSGLTTSGNCGKILDTKFTDFHELKSDTK